MPSSREKVRPSVADEEAKPYPSPASPAQPVAVPQSQQQAAQVAQQAAAQAQQQQARQAAAKQGSGPLLPPPITPPPLPGVSRPAAAKATEEPRLTKPAETVSGAGARGGGMPLPLQPQQHGLGALAVAPGARGAFGRPPDGKLEGLGGAAGQGLNAALRGPVAAPGWATEAPPFVALHQLDAARGRGGALTRPDAAAAAAVAALRAAASLSSASFGPLGAALPWVAALGLLVSRAGAAIGPVTLCCGLKVGFPPAGGRRRAAERRHRG